MPPVRFVLAIALAAVWLQAQPKPKLGDHSSGSRAQPAHIIPLRDPEGDTIQPGDRHSLPFSVEQTCGGDCHDVAAIGRGWHFNAMTHGTPPGRPGQPWIWIDRETGTQIPLSYRGWTGTYRPEDVGIGSYEFAARFGGRHPGGIPSGTDSPRWRVSGGLDVNCLTCHDGSPSYDQAEFANQVAQGNFRYAAASASGLAQVSGSVRELPDFFDYLLPNSVEDSLQAKVPRVQYSADRFLGNGKVAFNIVRQVASNRCYYCHTNADTEQTGDARWKANEDIHLQRGIQCVQCHRNGLDHMMSRGVEGAGDASLTCKGCHAEGNAAGAPHPDHEGIPPIHFEKLTCTACHAGPKPGDAARQFKNGMTHGLGEFNVDKSPDAAPHLYYPVFARGADGKIGPNRLVWPAFWGRLHGGKVQPLSPDVVKKAKASPAALEASLRSLGDDAVYISGGKLHRLEGASLREEENPQAQPYLWPLAHDVRPATQALGAKGCEDCHSEKSPIFSGLVRVDGRAESWPMHRFEKDLNIDYQTRLARSWRYRPWFKGIGLTAAALLLLVLLAYALRGVERLSAATIGRLR